MTDVGHSDIAWYVVQTQPNAERKALAHLSRQGFTAYLPRYHKKRRHARRTEIIAAPLFPRYMFVSIDMASQRWRSIRSTVGVSNLVCNGEAPAAVPPGIVEALLLREGEDGLIDIGPGPQFAHGDKIRVRDGAFGDCLGIFESATDSERVLILLDLLCRKVRVVLHVDDVVAA
ncbi:MAG: transcriptional activator RfaH [Pseudolabrys sp.]|nr:transcriptional activator RfaH [Pseudolabrys sp.]